MNDLTMRSTHFDFGKNWTSYAKLIDAGKLDRARFCLARMMGDMEGKSFLDIGCGSGLSSLAALTLGTGSVTAIDIDEDSASTTTALLASARSKGWEVRHQSVFDMPAETFDIVYSWGVLHHTGDMWRAIERSAAAVAPSGMFAFALYEKTPLCGAWRIEKRFYSHAPGFVQAALRGAYEAMQMAARMATGRSPFVRRREIPRGMDHAHDVHDWLGGYPYESTTFTEVDPFMKRLGFALVSHAPARVRGRGIGGSACSEYVYRRV